MKKENDVVRQKTLADIKQINFDIQQLKAQKRKLEVQLAIYDQKMYGDKK